MENAGVDDPEREPPKVALERHYDSVMRHNNANLFSSFATYCNSLPVRMLDIADIGLKLVDFPFFARTEDMEVTVSRLESQSKTARAVVKYAVSPTCTGKTACICAGFLHSAMSDRRNRFSHYLYLAFANNDGYHFAVTRNDLISQHSPEVAESQGAAFMLACLQQLLSAEDQTRTVRIAVVDDPPPPPLKETSRAILDYLDQNMAAGRILVHVDEHRKMSDNGAFRRGALSVLATVQRVTVVATYVEVPVEISADNSSAVCRDAVPIPVLDVEAATRYAGVAASADGIATSSAAGERLVATLKFRLASYLSNQMTILHLAYSPDFDGDEDTRGLLAVTELQELCNVYSRTVEHLNDKRHVNNFFALSPSQFMARHVTDNRIRELFLGMTESDVDQLNELNERLIGHLVAIATTSDGQARLSYGLSDLMTIPPPPPANGAYLEARRLFKSFINRGSAHDWLSGGTPLERAYLWALSTRFSVEGRIEFPGKSFELNCQRVRSGRVFVGDGITHANIDVSGIEKDTIYYADEGAGKKAHPPLGDIIFRTPDNELVLIDITASTDGSRALTRKRNHIKDFATAWSQNPRNQWNLSFVIISPLEKRASRVSSDCPTLRYVYGEDAKELLGGLVQFMAWY